MLRDTEDLILKRAENTTQPFDVLTASYSNFLENKQSGVEPYILKNQ